LKPMNCPSHHVLFGSKRRSYRELPVRYSTQDVLHRNELSGALSGLTRVRQFQQDDAHIYLAESDITDEVRRLVGILNLIYRTFGLTYAVRLSTRPEQSIGDAESWARAEAALTEALVSLDLPFTINPGDGAFYGPKIDFAVTDSIGREWQLGTIQLDYAAPERFDLTYVGADNTEHRPVVIHRAIYGSFERFIAILIEHFAGAFPLWLAPEQVTVVPISQELTAYGQQVADALRGAGLRVGFDAASTDDYRVRIREASVMKVPYMAVLGRREAEAGTVTVRRRGQEKRQETMPLADFVARGVDEVRTRALPHDYVDLGAVAAPHTDGAPAHGGVTNSAPPD
ncbi:MAG: His/Gly/Thr/Pro-type tRNA ligase C-terminal domain-containing protein, partial [Candidatus Eremiobacteraeota bacterium]|nr:His/Gly/Thr/Pro-type tRNA ligase C-terminal domain-containing protein [Candidatus Eremiobacteraeota bacterium]